jgi:UDP-N-acetyl-D-glucosamine dehydrogenase
VLLLGVAYKPNVGDVRESPALKIIDLLQDMGAELRYHDVHVPELPAYGLHSSELEDEVADADLVVIVTAHRGIDYGDVAERARRVLDLRGVTRDVVSERVVRL